MKTIQLNILLIVCIIVFLNSCHDGILRGHEEISEDGSTYLVVEDDNGGQCGPILIDGEKWKHGINVKVRIEPGLHKIDCGGEIEFEIKKGTIFYFDYWGP